ncbi:MAG: CPBP family intramembrane metalloprotease [Acidobacteriia bacterium]|nr:CPBP family intramembrane metalloprotease [Terriglobia bacterium]
MPLYILCTFGLSSILWFLIIKSGHVGGAGGAYVAALMWCPALGALLTCKILGRDAGSLGWKWGQTRYQVISYLIPLGYATLTYGIVWLTGLGGFYNKRFVAAVGERFGLGPLPAWASIAMYLFFFGTTGVVRGCATALGEEIGWRGFLVPELAGRTSFTLTALISGSVWALWHYPILIFADYNAGTPTWYSLTCFTVMVVGLSFAFAWLRLKSGSLWTGAIMHASHNLFVQAFFDPITADTGPTKYVIGEFGAALAVTLVLVGTYFWTRRGELRSNGS